MNTTFTQTQKDTVLKLQNMVNVNKDFNLFAEAGIYANVLFRINEVGFEQCKKDIDTEINALSINDLWLKHLLIDIRNNF